MTGAPAPEGADAVVMVEHTERLPKDEVAVLRSVPAGANIAPRGSERRQGDLLMPPATRLGVLEVAGLAAVGEVPGAGVPAPRGQHIGHRGRAG